MAKRTIAILLLLTSAAFAADSYYQIPSPEGSGKKMRSINQTVGANDVYQQNILVSDPTSSYVATVNDDGSLNVRLKSSTTNTTIVTTATLNSGASYTSPWIDTEIAGHGFTVSVLSDKSGHTYHQQSHDMTTIMSADDYPFDAATGHHEEHIGHARYSRFVLVNDSGENQTSLVFSIIQRHMDGFGTVRISPSDNLVSQDGIWENKITDGIDTMAVAADGSIAVTGTFYQTTQPVSSTNLDVRDLTSTSDSVECKQATGTNLHTVIDSGTVGVTGTFWQATQPVSGTFYQATQPVSLASMPSTPVTGTFWQATQPVSGTVTASQGTAANLKAEVIGIAADNSAAATNNVSTLPAVVEVSTTPITRTDGNRAALIEDSDGKVYVRTFDWDPLFATSGLSTGTTLAQLIAAPGAGVSVYITGWKCSASVAATTTTDQQCTIKYGTGTNCATGTGYIDGCFQGANGGCAESMDSPIKILANNAVCWVHAAAGSKIVRINYFLAP